MTAYGNKEIFSAKGKIEICYGDKVFVATSEKYLTDNLNRLPVGKEVTCTFYEHKATRSSTQLAYHMVLMGYVAEHTGYTREECHDAIMRIVFGTKIISLGGMNVQVRQSISDGAKMKKEEVTELIMYDLELCGRLEINVPSAESLGYTPSNK